VSSFSPKRSTPPLRLTRRVSTVCAKVAPWAVAHAASTGMRKLTRSLCRSPSESVLITWLDTVLNFRLTRAKTLHSTALRQVVVPCNNARETRQSVGDAVLPLSRAHRIPTPIARDFRSDCIGQEVSGRQHAPFDQRERLWAMSFSWVTARSEERRVGKEGRARRSAVLFKRNSR